jgi:general secretion pathway protein C
MKRMPLILSLLAVIALSASLAYWVLQLYTPQQRPLAAPPPTGLAEPSLEAGATVFGGQVLVTASNYQLTGVVAAGREGVAILVADGQPPVALPVGKEVAPGVIVKEVHPRYVMLSEGGVLKRIDLATDAKAGADLMAGNNGNNGGDLQMPDRNQIEQQMQQLQQPPTSMPEPEVPPEMQQPEPEVQPNLQAELPNGVPPPPQQPQMPAPTRNFSNTGSAPPTQ